MFEWTILALPGSWGCSAGFWKTFDRFWQTFEDVSASKYDKFQNMAQLYKQGYTVFWIFLHMAQLPSIMPGYAWICLNTHQYAWTWLNIAESAWICMKMSE